MEYLGTKGSAAAGSLVRAVTCDSRTVVPGALFVAVRGFAADGHRFIENAVSRGAVAVVCEEYPSALAGECLYILVPDARRALAEAAGLFWGKPSGRLRLIGVTGTNGKTTTAKLITSMLNENGVQAGYIGTNLCMIGDEQLTLDRTTPEADLLHSLFARMVDAGCSSAVMEVSSHALMLERVYGLRFEAAVFTNLTMEHLDFHVSMEEYAAAKQKLFDQLAPDGFAVFNADDPSASQMMSRVEHAGRYCCTLDEKDGGPVCGKKFRAERQYGSIAFSDVKLHFPDTVVQMQVRLPGSYNVMNVLEAAAVGVGMGLDARRVCSALEAVSVVEGRMERVDTPGSGFNVFVDYAHTPDALRKALETLRELKPPGSRLVVVFGCGGDRDKSKRPEMGRIASEIADTVILTSDNPRSEEPEAILDEIEPGIMGVPHFRICDRREAIGKALSLLSAGDILLVAGKGHEKYQEIRGRKEYFSDQDVIGTFLNTMGAALAESPDKERG
ncbi:MAG: UDP-N-acetylmuramoyl-L-alanyl-D-glutamate--2,6-diaminopimelate ligase [Chlorobiaceae bacterium]|nr:UDP-N-acetylmuramoyl-L-alanyl-D-glutamate--2,6-diaminopimelate ligase [Chlorobiaceae bacterium]NTV59950.1 UDP-N-acetylmuramoyl-L-alanyl-D-glutamate--2,6-diaminopimelate ligase [Chlorobiaceae bacterium]